jgi:hypothetical protein
MLLPIFRAFDTSSSLNVPDPLSIRWNREEVRRAAYAGS